ncbi:MAG: CAP domain-containing protein [Pseudomonadota bacterium]
MLRALSVGVVLIGLAGCSMGSQNLSMGFNDPAEPEAETSSGSLFSGGFASKSPKPDTAPPASEDTRVASLSQRAPGSLQRPRRSLTRPSAQAGSFDQASALKLINAYRRKKGLRALKLNPALAKAAKLHSRDLAKWDRISHYGSDGSNPWDRVKRVGFKAKLAAENVGTGQKSLAEVMEGWKKSPGHNKNLLLPDATHMGIALVNDPKTEFKTFWTLVLGTPL